MATTMDKKLVVEFGGYAEDGEYTCVFEAATPTLTTTEVFERSMNMVGRPIHEAFWRLALDGFNEIEDSGNALSSAIIQGFTVSSYNEDDGSTVLFESGAVGECVRVVADARRFPPRHSGIFGTTATNHETTRVIRLNTRQSQ